MKTYRIATIPGDGIGKEVVPAGQQVLQALAAASGTLPLRVRDFGWGGDWYRAHGEMMPADGLDALRGKDAILFGSAGDPHIPDHITLWGLRLKICQGFDQYANVRPTRILPGIDGPLKRCGPTTWTGSSCARTPRASTPASAAACTRATRSRPPPTCHDDPRRRRAHHALRLQAGAVAPAQAADRGHQEQRPAPRDGDVGRDRAAGGRSSRTSPGTRNWSTR
jgi:hypothetical protein